jgi:acyl-CoA thioester hydrolase
VRTQDKPAPELANPYLFPMPEAKRQPAASVIEFLVRYSETDQMQVVYHANYLVWCEMGRTDLIKQLGSSYAELEEQGVMLAVIDLSVRYHAAAKYDNTIRVTTIMTDVRSRTVTFEYTIENAKTGSRLASAKTTLASLNPQGKLIALPTHLRQAIENAIT